MNGWAPKPMVDSLRCKPAAERCAVHLTDDYRMAALKKMTIADIKQGVFVGATAVPLPNGMLRAIEIHPIPRGQNGNSFSRPFDLTPDGSTTNATVSTTVDGVDSRTITLTYKGGEKKVVIPANALIDETIPADRADVHAGVVVSLSADKLADGTLQASRLVVGKNGVNPPIQREPVSGLLADLLRLRPETHGAGYRCDRSID
jgi:hypothetical protein